MQSQNITVLIIGAGISGLKAAHKLIKKSKKFKHAAVDFKIIEGSDYIGGRVCSSDFLGTTLEEGSHMVIGTNKMMSKPNPIFKLAKKADLNTVKVGLTDPYQVVDANDPMADKKKLKKEFEKVFMNYYSGMGKAAKNLKKSDLTEKDDLPARVALQTFGKISAPQTRMENLVEQLCIDFQLMEDPMKVSAFHMLLDDTNSDKYGDAELNVHDQRGFSAILAKMMKDLTEFKAKWDCPESRYAGTPMGASRNNASLGGVAEARRAGIWLNHTVHRVDYTAEGVQVTAWDAENNQEAVFQGDYVISTASFGVLKNRVIEFAPPLPGWKQAALNEVEMGHMTKVFLNFSYQFWDNAKDLYVASQDRGKYPVFTWVNPKNYKKQIKDWPSSKNCLVGIVVGQEALRLDSLSEDQIKDEIERMFTAAFQHLVGQVDFRPTDARVVRWSNNPLTFGSVATYPVKCLSGQISFDHLREPLDPLKLEDPVSQPPNAMMTLKDDDFLYNRHPRLFFAGDGFDPDFSGLAQGAYFSGKRVAKQILNLIS